ncbi:MAG TPA: hypothetical protein VMW08_11295 [Acidimicrobiales bacterium]|nr:hypothetical protein [Acidimicrobiales bacterium]
MAADPRRVVEGLRWIPRDLPDAGTEGTHEEMKGAIEARMRGIRDETGSSARTSDR